MKRAAARAAEGEDEVSTGLPKAKAKSEWPKVQLYCLVSSRGDNAQLTPDGNEGCVDSELSQKEHSSPQDWHVDFAASSVYYTVHTGSKVFFFIRPTEANLAAYAKCELGCDCH